MLAISSTREDFGPGSSHPFIAINLHDTDTHLDNWLRDLPCPVFGVGEGMLADACDVVLENEKKLPLISANIKKTPLSAMVLVQHLRMSEHLSFPDALTAESLAYATVQKGLEFNHWLANHKFESPKERAAPVDLNWS